MTSGNPPYKLNVGCGRNIKEGWINPDSAALPGFDLVCDLESVRARPIAFPDESVDQFLISHVIEHIRDSLGLMQDLWLLATPGAIAVIRVPHGGSDDAWEDPTHLRAYYPGSFGYFSQPFHSNADYGYRADWNPDKADAAGLPITLRGPQPARHHQQITGRKERCEGDDLRRCAQ